MEGHEVAEGHAIHEFHGEVVVCACLAAVVKPDDVGMLEAGHELDLALEAVPLTQSGKRTRQEHLQRDNAVGGLLDRLVDHALRPTVDLPDNPISVDPGDISEWLDLGRHKPAPRPPACGVRLRRPPPFLALRRPDQMLAKRQALFEQIKVPTNPIELAATVGAGRQVFAARRRSRLLGDAGEPFQFFVAEALGHDA